MIRGVAVGLALTCAAWPAGSGTPGKAPIGLQVEWVRPGGVFNVCDAISFRIRARRPVWIEVLEGPAATGDDGFKRMYPRHAGEALLVDPGVAAVFPPPKGAELVAMPPTGTRRFRVVAHAFRGTPTDPREVTRQFGQPKSGIAADDVLQQIDIDYHTVNPARRTTCSAVRPASKRPAGP